MRFAVLLALAACSTNPQPVKRPLCQRRYAGSFVWQTGRVDTIWVYTQTISCRLPGDSL